VTNNDVWQQLNYTSRQVTKVQSTYVTT